MKRPFKLIVINSSVRVCVYIYDALRMVSHFATETAREISWKTCCFPRKSRIFFLEYVLSTGLSLGRNYIWNILIIVAKN